MRFNERRPLLEKIVFMLTKDSNIEEATSIGHISGIGNIYEAVRYSEPAPQEDIIKEYQAALEEVDATRCMRNAAHTKNNGIYIDMWVNLSPRDLAKKDPQFEKSVGYFYVYGVPNDCHASFGQSAEVFHPIQDNWYVCSRE
jgi:hypothetical protein